MFNIHLYEFSVKHWIDQGSRNVVTGQRMRERARVRKVEVISQFGAVDLALVQRYPARSSIYLVLLCSFNCFITFRTTLLPKWANSGTWKSDIESEKASGKKRAEINTFILQLNTFVCLYQEEWWGLNLINLLSNAVSPFWMISNQLVIGRQQ